MAPSYNTIPAAAEDSLLAPKKSNKIKGLVAGAAIAAFVLVVQTRFGGEPPL